MNWFATGGLLAGTAVALGAFGAHGLEGHVTPERLEVFETGVRYQMFHALALFAVGYLATRQPSALLRTCGWCFTVGSLIFSGSLYALVLLDLGILGAVTPLGGVAQLAGWVCFVVAALRSQPRSS